MIFSAQKHILSPSSSSHQSVTFPKVARVNTYTTVLEKLTKFTNYTIQVLGFTVAGDGPLSHIETCATHTDGKPFLLKLYETKTVRIFLPY